MKISKMITLVVLVVTAAVADAENLLRLDEVGDRMGKKTRIYQREVSLLTFWPSSTLSTEPSWKTMQAKMESKHVQQIPDFSAGVIY